MASINRELRVSDREHLYFELIQDMIPVEKMKILSNSLSTLETNDIISLILKSSIKIRELDRCNMIQILINEMQEKNVLQIIEYFLARASSKFIDF